MKNASGSGAQRRPRPLTGPYIIRKVLASLGTLLFVVLFNFFLFRILPGDPAKAFMPRGRNADRQALEEMRDRLGVDQPLQEQFFRYLKQLAQFDLGESWSLHQSVGSLIWERFWPTVLLSGTSLVLAAIVGVWIGSRTGWRYGSRLDKAASSSAITLYSTPEWFLGLLLLAITAKAGLFPAGGMTNPRSDLPEWIDVLWHSILPISVLAIVYIAEYSLIMRASILDERKADYLTTARAKGLRDSLVLRRHALPNALLPSTTLFFLSMGFVVSGAITVETVFSWPGLGRLTYEALRGPDIPLLQGLFLVFSAGVILMNLISDLLMPFLDPRVRAA